MGYNTTYNTARRAMLIYRRLLESHTGQLEIKRMASELEVSVKTVKRYIDNVLKDVFHDSITVKAAKELNIEKGNSKFLVMNKYDIERRTGFQLAPLYLSRFMLNFLNGSSFTDALDQTLDLFEQNLVDRKSGAHYGDISNKFHAVAIGPKDYAELEDVIDNLLLAVINQHPCTITYHRARAAENATYEIKPLTLVVYKQGLYVLSDVEGYDRHPFFAVERIDSITVDRKETFNYPRRFKPQDYISGSFGIFNEGKQYEVEISFSPAVADYVRSRTWHPSQQIINQQDGGCTLRMEVNALTEVYTWVLSFGKEALVVAPRKLIDMIAEQVQGLVKMYD